MWDLWWTKWHWDRFFFEFFGVSLSITFQRRFPTHIIWGMKNISDSDSSSETSRPIKRNRIIKLQNCIWNVSMLVQRTGIGISICDWRIIFLWIKVFPFSGYSQRNIRHMHFYILKIHSGHAILAYYGAFVFKRVDGNFYLGWEQKEIRNAYFESWQKLVKMIWIGRRASETAWLPITRTSASFSS
jgi:hypothetical protein